MIKENNETILQKPKKIILFFLQNRNIENRQEFDICNRDSLKNECLFKLYLSIKTTVKEVIRLIAEHIEYPQQQIIIQRPSR